MRSKRDPQYRLKRRSALSSVCDSSRNGLPGRAQKVAGKCICFYTDLALFEVPLIAERVAHHHQCSLVSLQKSQGLLPEPHGDPSRQPLPEHMTCEADLDCPRHCQQHDLHSEKQLQHRPKWCARRSRRFRWMRYWTIAAQTKTVTDFVLCGR